MPLSSIDLTHFIHDDMPVYPGDLIPGVKEITSIEVHGYNERELIMSTHTGTHIDAPAHIIPEGASLDSFPPGKYIGDGFVVDCRQINLITEETILSSLSDYNADFILLYTGWDTHWGTDLYFKDIPVLDSDAAKYLSNLPVKGIGIDAPSFDPIGSVTLRNHNLLLEKNIILIENLTGLSKLLEKEFMFSCFPLKIENADGSPVRAVAIVQE